MHDCLVTASCSFDRPGESTKREEFGAFYTLFGELREDANKFLNYFRMSVSSFDEMHRCLKESLQLHNSKMGNCIQPVEILSVAVR